MGELLPLQFTIFVLIAVGILAKKLRFVDGTFQKGLTNLVINVILPCNIVNSFLVDFESSILLNCGAVLLISLGIQIFCVLYGKFLYRNQPENRQKNLRYGIICSNAGFLGNPIAEGVFGSMGLLLASIYLIPLRVMMWSEGIAIYSGVNDRKAAVRRVLTHPCVVACMIGIPLMLFNVHLPEFIATPLKTIGRCNTAMSMLVIGMILADVNIRDMFDKDIAVFTVHRLIVIPVLVFAVLKLLHTDALITGVSVLLAAMPAGTTTAMLAEKYGQDAKFASKLVVFSTVCSIPAICIWSMLLR